MSLGPIRPDGLTHCQRVIAGTVVDNPDPVVCGKPATVHLDLSREHDATLLSCDDHVTEARRTFDVRDEHPFGGVCAMPETLWIDSTDEGPGRCVWMIEDDDLAVEANEPTPEPVLAGVSS